MSDAEKFLCVGGPRDGDYIGCMHTTFTALEHDRHINPVIERDDGGTVSGRDTTKVVLYERAQFMAPTRDDPKKIFTFWTPSGQSFGETTQKLIDGYKGGKK